jgi:hypothetical protein
MARPPLLGGRSTESPMWIALSMMALFIGYCWYDSVRMPPLEVTEWSGDFDDDTEWRREMMDFLDEMSETKLEDHSA